MNILIVCHFSMYREFSRSFVHNQAKAYAALGHRVRVLVPIAIGVKDWDNKRFSSALQKREQDGVELFLLRRLSLSKYGKYAFNTPCCICAISRKFHEILDGFSPDVIHTHTLGMDSEVGAWLKTKLHVPVVTTTHGSDTIIPMNTGKKEFLKKYCDSVDAVIAVSGFLKKYLEPCGTKTPIHAILNGFDIHHLPDTVMRDSRPALSIAQTSGLIPQKNVDITIRAFAKVYSSHPEAVLTVFGDGSERKSLESLCRQLNVSDAVHFMGNRSNQEVLCQLTKTRFYVMPSVREGLPISYLEAMGSGCITIGTADEGIAEVITSGENGFLVSPDDPEKIAEIIEWCLSHPEEANMIAQKGREKALGMSWEDNASNCVRLFESLIKRRST